MAGGLPPLPSTNVGKYCWVSRGSFHLKKKKDNWIIVLKWENYAYVDNCTKKNGKREGLPPLLYVHIFFMVSYPFQRPIFKILKIL